MASAAGVTRMMASSVGGQPGPLLRWRQGGGGGPGVGVGAAGAATAAAAAAARARPSRGLTTQRSNSSIADHVGAAVTAVAAPTAAAAAAAAAAGRPAFPNQSQRHQQQLQQHQHERQRRRRRPDVSTAAEKGGGGKGGGIKGGGGGGDPPSEGSSDGQPRPPPRGGPAGSAGADKTKADFSAYWALRFREAFSKRRKYLDSAIKAPKGDLDPTDADEWLAEFEESVGERQLEAEVALAELRAGGQAGLRARADAAAAAEEQDAEIARRAREKADRFFGWMDKKRRQRQQQQQQRQQQQQQQGGGVGAGGGEGDGGGGGGGGEWAQGAASLGDVQPEDAERMLARRALSYAAAPRVRVLYNAMGAAAAAARAVATAPVALPVALWRRWRSIFDGPGYTYFLDQEAMRMWYWRNRMENERWFWEIYFWDRMLLPTVWTLVYVAAAPPNLLWCALIPLLMLAWRDGRMHGPRDWEWWLLMVFGVFGKCRGQIADFVRAAVTWGV